MFSTVFVNHLDFLETLLCNLFCFLFGRLVQLSSRCLFSLTSFLVKLWSFFANNSILVSRHHSFSVLNVFFKFVEFLESSELLFDPFQFYFLLHIWQSSGCPFSFVSLPNHDFFCDLILFQFLAFSNCPIVQNMGSSEVLFPRLRLRLDLGCCRPPLLFGFLLSCNNFIFNFRQTPSRSFSRIGFSKEH